MPGSAHYEGRAVDVFVRPISPRNKTRAGRWRSTSSPTPTRLEINTVIFDAPHLDRAAGRSGLARLPPDTLGPVARDGGAILEHRDHVHVDVAD